MNKSNDTRTQRQNMRDCSSTLTIDTCIDFIDKKEAHTRLDTYIYACRLCDRLHDSLSKVVKRIV